MKFYKLKMKALPRISYAASNKEEKGYSQRVVDNYGYTALRFVDTGKMEINILGSKLVLGSGNYIITPANIPYEYRVLEDCVFSMFSFFLDEGVQDVVDRDQIVFEHSKNYVYVEIESLFVPLYDRIGLTEIPYKKLKSLISNYDGATEYINVTASADCVDFFVELAKNSLPKIMNAENSDPNRLEVYCNRIDEYINEYYSQPITMTTISGLMIMHENYIGHIYKKMRGITVMQHLKNVRMEKAKKLLSTNKYSVAQVAKMVGYRDTRYFITTFRKIEKISPGKYYDSFLRQRVFSYDPPEYLDIDDEGVY